jgi:hypothetical protein
MAKAGSLLQQGISSDKPSSDHLFMRKDNREQGIFTELSKY